MSARSDPHAGGPAWASGRDRFAGRGRVRAAVDAGATREADERGRFGDNANHHNRPPSLVRSWRAVQALLAVAGGTVLGANLVNPLGHIAPDARAPLTLVALPGANLGPVVTPFGSRATLLWLAIVRRQGEDRSSLVLLANSAAFMQRAGGYTFAGSHLATSPDEVADPGCPTRSRRSRTPHLLALVDVRVVLSWTPLAHPRLVLLDAAHGANLYHNPRATGRAVTAAPERPTVVFTAPAESYLVIGSPAYPGWRLALDGRLVADETLAGTLPAVQVAPGPHRPTYVYRPAAVRAGAWLALLGLLGGTT